MARLLTRRPILNACKLDMLTANLRGAGWILASGIAATFMSVGIRALAPEMHSTQITFVRCVLGFFFILPFVYSHGMAELSTRHWRLHLARGLLGAVGINLGYYSLTIMPLATATVLFFTAPLFVTVLAGWMLGEYVGWRRWTATVAGFLGTFVVVGYRPGGFQLEMLVAVVSSLAFALALVLGKRLTMTERTSTIMFYFAALTSLLSLGPAMVTWTPPSPSQMALLLVVAVFASARTFFDLRGYKASEASFVAPFQYLRIIFMGVAGYCLFAELPERGALAGAAVIILSTLYIAQQEAALGRVTKC